MTRRLIDILPKIPQYEDIPYAADLECPECGKTGFYDYNWGPKHEKPKLIGWCDTNIGKMGVFECTCGQRYRFVMIWTDDDREFDMYLYYKAKECTNWEEIKKQLD